MKSFKELKRNLKKDIFGMPILNIALVGDTATQFLATAIEGYGIEKGLKINLFEAEYNQVEQQFMDSNSDLYRFNADYIIVFQSTHKLGEKYSSVLPEQQSFIADERLDFIKSICANTKSKIIYLNYAEIEDTVFGSYANKVVSSFTYQIRRLNYELMNLAIDIPNLYICDLAGLQNKYGRDYLYNAAIYTSTEMVLSIDAVPLVAARLIDIISAAKGKFKKCLILDLDNTLWGGIIGDDGIEGIQLGHGLGIGKAFSEFQLWIKKLKNRGIILCVCSKNTESIAKEPFLMHPDMILKLDDIAVFRANWETKVDNIRSIQQILNIGFDSMVFLDDNPFERNMVRENIAEITVPELPEDPADYLEFLYSENLFETVSYNSADKDRTQQYKIEAERVDISKSFTNESDFLQSLNMISEVSDFNKFNAPRVAQLSQRSNQFNLRTIRYTDLEINELSTNPEYKNFCFTLTDKFGENGLICVIVLHKQDTETLFIDSWFMSCRVLKRGMENYTLNTIMTYAIENGFKKVIGEYIPTQKNSMVKDHYEQLGFTKIENSNDLSRYQLLAEDYQLKECYIIKHK